MFPRLSQRRWRDAIPLFTVAAMLLLVLGLNGVAGLLRPPYDLPRLEVDTAEELARVFARRDYTWPPQGPVPALALAGMPRGMDELAVERKKSLFFRALLPLVLAENARIAAQRERLQAAFARGDVDPGGLPPRLGKIARLYGVDGSLAKAENRAVLLRRVDTVPVALVLAQAANESGWGSSRFTRQANNLFGIWTYQASRGLKPRARASGATHFVRVYPDLQDAVRAYLHNLNVGHAYAGLRQRRAAMRAAGRPLNALELAEGLERYSERGTAYVEEIQAMIRGNALNRLGDLRLAG